MNCWSDVEVDAGLKNTPFSRSQAALVIDRSIFQRVVIAASGSYLSEIDAGLLYDKGEIIYDMLCRRNNKQLTTTKWDLLCAMLKKQLMICHLARTLSTGENLLAQQPSFMLKSNKSMSTSEFFPDNSGSSGTGNVGTLSGISSANSSLRPNPKSKLASSTLESTYRIKDVRKPRKSVKGGGAKNGNLKNVKNT